MNPEMPPPYALQKTTATAAWCEPRSLEDAVRLAKTVSDSSFCPAAFRGKSGDVLIAMHLGAEVGLSPMAAIQNVAVINGRPSLWGDAMLAVCRAHPDFEDIVEEISSDGQAAICTVRRRGQSPTVCTFTMEDAKRARLAGKKGPWQEYPKRMLKLRARGFALRDAFPDALRGMISAEEARDMPIDLPLDEDGVPTHEIKRTRAEDTLARVKAKREPRTKAAEVNVAGVGKAPALAAVDPAEYERLQRTGPGAAEYEPAEEVAVRSMADAEKAASAKVEQDLPGHAEAAAGLARDKAKLAAEVQERNEVLVEVVKICKANGTEQADMLAVVQSILQRNVPSAEAMTLKDCIEVRRVLLEEQSYTGAEEALDG